MFGAQAAAQYHFTTGVAYLTNQQAYLLAAILPSPLTRSASKPSSATQQRARWIGQQVRQLGGSHYLNGLKPVYPEWFQKASNKLETWLEF